MAELNRRTVLHGAAVTTMVGASGCLEEVRSAAGSRGGDEPDDGGQGDAGGSDATVECEAVDDYETLEEYPRVDEPPHTILPEKEDGFDPDDIEDWESPTGWNLDRLGACIREEPSLEFHQIDVHRSAVRFDKADIGAEMTLNRAGFWAGLITNEDGIGSVFDLDKARDSLSGHLTSVDFQENALVLIHSGLGSGSLDHRWTRAEPREGAVHLHGFYIDPFDQDSDLDDHLSLLAINHEGDIPAFAYVSLTIGTDVRVNFDSTEGSVQVSHEIDLT